MAAAFLGKKDPGDVPAEPGLEACGEYELLDLVVGGEVLIRESPKEVEGEVLVPDLAGHPPDHSFICGGQGRRCECFGGVVVREWPFEGLVRWLLFPGIFVLVVYINDVLLLVWREGGGCLWAVFG